MDAKRHQQDLMSEAKEKYVERYLPLKLKCFCGRCYHIWTSTMPSPNVCPRCHSKSWRKIKYPFVCLKCGSLFHSSSPGPNRCPKCHERYWSADLLAERIKHTCGRLIPIQYHKKPPGDKRNYKACFDVAIKSIPRPIYRLFYRNRAKALAEYRRLTDGIKLAKIAGAPYGKIEEKKLPQPPSLRNPFI